ncbi:MAG: fasciclin domain-containing protein [Bacteroidales bacterium]|jgi:uncharacterized surface protein with fasciclin (FAS1) repeats|nr:fasciclin domain-containing protein [Bacteroidales bacterium]
MKTSYFHKAMKSLCTGTLAGILCIFLMLSCERDLDENFRISEEKMIDEIMEENNLSSFLSIVEKAGFSGTIHAYGFYTLFAPTDAAVSEYLQTAGKSSVNDISEEEAADMVRYHLIRDTLSTSGFVDGRLASPNFLKKYLTTKTASEGNRILRIINRQARIIENGEDLRGANGYLHIIDQVLTPPDKSITGIVRSLDNDYSLFKEFFEDSGLAETLDTDNPQIWYSCFIEDNEALNDAGVTSKESLLAIIHENQKSSAKSDEEHLRDYIGYHVVVDSIMPKFGVDLLKASSLFTLTSERKPILFERIDGQVYLNRLVQGQLNEPGVLFDSKSELSDLSCSNGVVHRILGDIQIKERTAYRIYWDIAEQPELMALKNFRQQGCNVSFKAGELSELTWGGRNPTEINYQCGTIPATESAFNANSQYIYADFLRFNLHPEETSWMEFKTPVLMPGEYKVWLAWRREGNRQLKTIFKQEGKDDQVMPYIFNQGEYMPNPANSSHEQLALNGWKQYNAKKYSSVVCCHILGTIKVEFEGRHTLRLEPVYSNSKSQRTNFDMIQFIPKDEDQLYPRVDMRGTWVPAGTPDWEIWPYGAPPADPDPATE